MRTLFSSVISFILLLGQCGPAWAEDSGAVQPLKVVATLSTFADIARAIGGEQVEVSAVAAPQFDPHFIDPKPSDVLRLKRANLFLHGGLDLEAWRGPLLDAVGRDELRPGGERSLDLSTGIELLNPPATLSRSGGDIHQFGNPHYWLAPENGERMALTIAEKLRELDPDHAPKYVENFNYFRETLQHAVAGIQEHLGALRGARVIAYHDSWPYFARFLGIEIVQYIEPKPGISPTPRHLEELERTIREEGIRVIIQESFYPGDAARHLAARTGVRVVELCQNVGEREECGSYQAMIAHNAHKLADALTKE